LFEYNPGQLVVKDVNYRERQGAGVSLS